jgi:hypothetical protein
MEWCVDERYPLPMPRTIHFTGSGIARFEPSTHRRYHGRRVVHLRIIKIVAPITRAVPTLQIYDDYVPDKPTEGHLLTVRRDGKRPERWECEAPGCLGAPHTVGRFSDVGGLMSSRYR